MTTGEWTVYLIRASDDRLYTGITTDMARRWRQHTDGSGAKFFRGRQPVAIVWQEGGHDRSSALRREAAIKGLSRAAKLVLVGAQTASAEADGMGDNGATVVEPQTVAAELPAATVAKKTSTQK